MPQDEQDARQQPQGQPDGGGDEDTFTPEFSTPDFSAPAFASPEFESHGYDSPGFASPGFASPNTPHGPALRADDPAQLPPLPAPDTDIDPHRERGPGSEPGSPS
ncbi:hypothetical protein [Streptomyces sp. NPDC054784]